MGLSLEGYPNRDSCKYKDLYQLKDAKKVLRGTLRFTGFTIIMNAIKAIGLFDATKNVEFSGPWPDYLNKVLAKDSSSKKFGFYDAIFQKRNVSGKDAILLAKILNKALTHPAYSKCSK